MVSTKSFYAHGKLLLTGEYAVLDGAEALCLPLQLGQKMRIKSCKNDSLSWEAYLPNQRVWFTARYDLNLNLIEANNAEPAKSLEGILKALKNLNQNLFLKGLKISTFLEFDKNWGLGSSSTLISLLAQWAEVNPYQFLNKTFGGSGYDVACATAQKPLIFKNGNAQPVSFDPPFKDLIYFVYLNQKQNSRDSINLYHQKEKNESFIQEISLLTQKITKAQNLSEFETLICQHEEIVSQQIGEEPVQQKLFPNYSSGVIKSLGGWGGDFVLVTGKKEALNYFSEKGFSTIFNYSELIL